MIELNLLDDDRISRIQGNKRDKKLRRTCKLIFLICGASLILLGGIFAILKLLNYNLTADIEYSKAEISQLQGSELDRNLTIQKALSEIGELHAKKQKYSLLLLFLQQLNIGADYKNILISDNDKITISGITSDFSTLDKLKNSFKSALVEYELNDAKNVEYLFKSVEITEGATETDKKVNFRMNLEVNGEIFKFDTRNASLNKDGKNE